LVSPSNFLLLDEPTNHLDMRAKDVLLEALAAFSGTVVFVSHDRYFIDGLATRVLEVEDGAVTMHEGNYEDYMRRKETRAAASSQTACHPERAERVEGPASQLPVPHPSDNIIDRRVGELDIRVEERNGKVVEPADTVAKDRQRRMNPIKQKQMEERCAFLEQEVPRVEASLRHTEEQLGVYVSAEETQRLAALAEDLRAQLTVLTAEWEESMAQLDGLTAL
ncbi:MAG: ABC transporter ATP-binding protein, partial [Terracidiphilus sp.]